MTKQWVTFTFSPETITEPIIYTLGQQFKIVTNIRQAALTGDRGWIVLELDGKEQDIDAGIAWVISKGARVDPFSGD